MKKYALLLLLLSACIHVPTASEQVANLNKSTGLQVLENDGTTPPLLGKDHRGYKVVLRFVMGDVWGRYAARLTMGEIGRELGGIWGFLTGQYQHISGSITGSPLDRLLSYAIGQPLSVTAILKHNKKNVPRLDILSSFSTIKPSDPVTHIETIAYLGAGSLYSEDVTFANRVKNNQALMKRLDCFRSQYIRVDDQAVTFLFAGSENEYSAMIRNCEGYENLVNTIMDSLADLADES